MMVRLMRVSGCAVLAVLLCTPSRLRAQVSVTDTVDQGQTCFKVTTPTARYYYQKEGCGFSSILDAAGNDWISYQPGGGAQGEYRGIPNLGWQFHPGYTNGGSTTLETNSSAKVSLRSSANGWVGTWDFYATHAVFTLTQRSDTYWFLYEGTPGGKMEPSRDYYYTPDNSQPAGVRRTVASQDRTGHLSPEWIAFGDPSMERVLVLAHHTDDAFEDNYYDMGGDGGMTVFGFGRKNDQNPCWYCMDYVPNVFTVALVEDTGRAAVRAFAESAIAGTLSQVDALPDVRGKSAGSPGRIAGKRQYDVQGRQDANGGGAACAPRVMVSVEGRRVLP